MTPCLAPTSSAPQHHTLLEQGPIRRTTAREDTDHDLWCACGRRRKAPRQAGGHGWSWGGAWEESSGNRAPSRWATSLFLPQTDLNGSSKNNQTIALARPAPAWPQLGFPFSSLPCCPRPAPGSTSTTTRASPQLSADQDDSEISGNSAICSV